MRMFWRSGREQDQEVERTVHPKGERRLDGARESSFPDVTRALELVEWDAETDATYHDDDPCVLLETTVVETDRVTLEPERAEVETLVEKLTDRRTRSHIGSRIWIAGAPIAALGIGASLLYSEYLWTPICLLAFVMALVLSRQAAKMGQESAALHNAHLDDRWIGPLCEALEWPDRNVQETAALLLIESLPRIRADDSDLFTDEQRTCLYRRLLPKAARSNPALAHVVLRALPYLGTEPALPYVERLAARPAITRAGRRIRDAARATLALLERRIAALRAAQTAPEQEALSASRTVAAAPETAMSESERKAMEAVSARVDREMAEFEADLRRLQAPGMRYGFLIASWLVIVPYAVVETVLQLITRNWAGVLLFAGLGAAASQLHRLTLTERHKLLARKLSKLDDVRCIGRLAEALEWPDATINQFAIAALTRLLPRVRSTDSVLHTARQRGNLYRMLNLSHARKHAEFLIAILRALEQVGDATAIPYVEQIAKAQPTSVAQRKICDAARECLEFVKIRADLNRSSQTLLRASSVTVAGSESLVRPIVTATPADPNELLRADASNGIG